MSDHQVNLVPPVVKSATTVRKVQRGLAWTLVLILAGTAALWLLQSTSISAAQARLDEARTQTTVLGNKVSALAPVGGLYQLLTEQESFITGALASQARSQEILTALRDDAGPRVEFTNVAMAVTGIPRTPTAEADTACPDADPFADDIAIGCLSFTASAKSRKDVSKFLLAAQADPRFVNPYVTTTTISESAEGTPSITFSGSVGISLDGLMTTLSENEIAELVAQRAAAAAPTDETTSESAEPTDQAAQ